MAIAVAEIKPMSGEEIRDALMALADTARKFVCTTPSSGQFKVIGVRRNATGNFEYEYDDVAES